MNIKLEELTFENLGVWPVWIKFLCAVIIFTIMVFLGYRFDLKAQYDQLRHARYQQVELMNQIISQQQQSVNLKVYRKQLEQLNVDLEKLVKRLPNHSEIQKLLEELARAGTDYGLNFKLIKPEAGIKKSFYTELPIKIEVIGNYHQLGQFISEISNLKFIVTLHDFTLEPYNVMAKKNEEQLKGLLLLKLTAKTYQY